MRTLAESGRASKYIQTASDLGLGEAHLDKIRLRSVEI
jgi:hypothetical protein